MRNSLLERREVSREKTPWKSGCLMGWCLRCSPVEQLVLPEVLGKDVSWCHKPSSSGLWPGTTVLPALSMTF